MKYTGKPVVESYSELVRALESFSAHASVADGSELAALWPTLERRILSRVRADELLGAGPIEAPLATEGQRIRNLAWEVGVSVDLQAVHLRALATLVRLLRERAEGSDGRAHGAERRVTVMPPTALAQSFVG